MAKIYEEYILIKLSKLLPSGAKEEVMVTAEMQEALAQLIAPLLFELTGTQLVIEIENAAE